MGFSEHYFVDDYRFGFNGMEKDDEVKGNGNSLDFGARIYDPRIGRFLSIDPLFASYSGETPYGYASNSPIYFIDKNGENSIGYIGDDGKLYIEATYHAVSEGTSSFTDVQMKLIENQANSFYGQAVGMKVTLSDGREVEVGGITIKVKPGGDFDNTVATAKGANENAMFNVTEKQFKKMRGLGNAEALTTSNLSSAEEKATLNTTFFNAERLAKPMVEAEQITKENSYVDEVGHVLGTRHAEKQKGESRKDFKAREQESFGKLERVATDFRGRLQLDKDDIQNIVGSDEFQLKDKKPKN